MDRSNSMALKYLLPLDTPETSLELLGGKGRSLA